MRRSTFFDKAIISESIIFVMSLLRNSVHTIERASCFSLSDILCRGPADQLALVSLWILKQTSEELTRVDSDAWHGMTWRDLTSGAWHTAIYMVWQINGRDCLPCETFPVSMVLELGLRHLETTFMFCSFLLFGVKLLANSLRVFASRIDQ